MKRLVLMIVVTLIWGMVLTSCSNETTDDCENCNDTIEEPEEPEVPNEKITITEGIWGTIVQREGNCRPPIQNTCKIFPVEREIWVYEYARRDKDAFRLEGSFKFFIKVNTELIAKTTSDEEGFFELALKPGKYSVFVLEKGLLYASISDGQGGIMPISVEPYKVSKYNLAINYALD